MFVLDVLKVYALYVGIVVGGTGLVMFLADSLGYLSYSDRPGSGWYGLHPHLSVSDAGFILGFIAFTAVLSVLSIAVPAVMLLTVAMRRCHVHRAIVGFVVAPLIAVATLWIFAVAGWYVAIGVPFILTAAGLSVIFTYAVSASSGLRLWRFRLRAF
jgi:hypothetical protein